MFIHGIEWILYHFMLVLFIAAIFITIIQKLIFPRMQSFSEHLYSWITLLPLGIGGLYGFCMHAFFPNISAQTIGWSNSPFQYEVAVANLGFGLVALFAFKASYGFRLANVLGITCWLWGDAVGHIYQMITQQNFTMGNAGSWFWMDVLCPLILIVCMINLSRKNIYE